MRRVAAVLVVAGLALPAGLARADDAPAPAPATSPEQPNLVKDVETSRETSREKDDSTNGSPRS